jgi:hypothetical protein
LYKVNLRYKYQNQNRRKETIKYQF